MAPPLKVEVIPINMHDAGQIERSVDTFAGSPGCDEAARKRGIMSQFFISSDNPESDLQRCHELRKFLSRLVITGATEQGEIKLFEGVVQSIEDHGENAPTGRRWRVMMIDEPYRMGCELVQGSLGRR